MRLSPDSITIFENAYFTLNGTILFTWLVMALVTLGSWLATRRLSTGPQVSRWQSCLESIVTLLLGQIGDVTRQEPRRFLPFIGTLFIFIAVCNLLEIIPGFLSPTGSLSTTAGLALSVLVAVPLYGVRDSGFGGYLKKYLQPNPMMLPFNILGELSRTLALAVRLFGNVMSGEMIGGILLAVTPLIFPVVMQLLGLLTGMVQAYIFAILAAVYIAAGLKVHEEKEKR
ncbi:F0F1 ATP synthase subunit A [Desulfopila sp. IMCC35006]|uniref:F0F1 ATP synthase subunit A n=1 Tax=Desulfopila sp. IMCC35006 TaxID=2569542 RepID=UPI0010AD1673|nr:F0F1 ATP synthase subunit A [Desulfopila sp. IMCC35006]TKB27461.1 F0F1 ATP synthase subunit A [Desulfopila sp. IMCC35006]